MALFRRFFYRKPPDRLLEISERVYVFDCCFSTNVFDEDEYKMYLGGIVAELQEHYPDGSFMVFNFREEYQKSQISDILSQYGMTVMDYPRQYEGCELLPLEKIFHFLRSSESWLSLADQQNVLLMHCERGGWPVLAFMLACLLLYRKQYTGEQKTLEMVYKQAPKELLHLLSSLNPQPSHLRYLQYISRRTLGSDWMPSQTPLALDCVILRVLPLFDDGSGCRPVIRVYGQGSLSTMSTRSRKLLASSSKTIKRVRLYRQEECELVKLDIHCRVEGDVVLECIHLLDDLVTEEIMFRVMFHTAFIRSKVLMLTRDEIDVGWDAKEQFPREFKAEVLFSDDSVQSIINTEAMYQDGIGTGTVTPEEFFEVEENFNYVVDGQEQKGDFGTRTVQESNLGDENYEIAWKEEFKHYRLQESVSNEGNHRQNSEMDSNPNAPSDLGDRQNPLDSTIETTDLSNHHETKEAVPASCGKSKEGENKQDMQGISVQKKLARQNSRQRLAAESNKLKPEKAPLPTAPWPSARKQVIPNSKTARDAVGTKHKLKQQESPGNLMRQAKPNAVSRWIPSNKGSYADSMHVAYPPTRHNSAPDILALSKDSQLGKKSRVPSTKSSKAEGGRQPSKYSSCPSSPTLSPTSRSPKSIDSKGQQFHTPPLPPSSWPFPPSTPSVEVEKRSATLHPTPTPPPLNGNKTISITSLPPPPPPPPPLPYTRGTRISSSRTLPQPAFLLTPSTSNVVLSYSRSPLLPPSPPAPPSPLLPPGRSTTISQETIHPPPQPLALSSLPSSSPPSQSFAASASSLLIISSSPSPSSLPLAPVYYTQKATAPHPPPSPPPPPPPPPSPPSSIISSSPLQLALPFEAPSSPSPSPPSRPPSSNISSLPPPPPPLPPPFRAPSQPPPTPPPPPSSCSISSPPLPLTSQLGAPSPLSLPLPPSSNISPPVAPPPSPFRAPTLPSPPLYPPFSGGAPPPPPPPPPPLSGAPPPPSLGAPLSPSLPPPPSLGAPPPPTRGAPSLTPTFGAPPPPAIHRAPASPPAPLTNGASPQPLMYGAPLPPAPRPTCEPPPPPPPPTCRAPPIPPMHGAPIPPPLPTNCGPPPPPPPIGGAPPPPPPPGGCAPGPPPPPGAPRPPGGGPPPPPPLGAKGPGIGGAPPPPVGRGRGLGRPSASTQNKRSTLKPLHWSKVSRALQGSLWEELQRHGEPHTAPEFDVKELETLFSACVPKSGSAGGKSGGQKKSAGSTSDRVHLIDLRRANNTEIMLTKVKMPLPDIMAAALALDESILDADQVENLIKFCPTKDEMDLLKGYTGDKEKLGKCEQFFLELMKVPRVESKLRVFLFKIQFNSQVSDFKKSLNTVNSACEEVRNSVKLKEIMKKILYLGNTLNQGTARGSAVGFKLDSLLKLTDTRASNSKMTLMHYLCKVLAAKSPKLLDFHEDLVNLEAASKIQLKVLAEEMQAISKGLEKVKQELAASENDGPVSEIFHKTLKEFIGVSEAEVASVTNIYSVAGKNADALALYFNEDPARCPFEQVTATLLNFVSLFRKAHEENLKQAELEKKKAEKEAEMEKAKAANLAKKGAKD